MAADPRSSYDDGGLLVPGGSATPVERVLVVGAGIAGLTVANALHHEGVDCVVLESRDRLGGRLHTIELAGSPVDLGGSWIHHPVGNPMSAFAARSGVRIAPGDPLPTMSGYDCGSGRLLTQADFAADRALMFEAFPEALESLRAELGPGASAAAAIDSFVSRLALPEDAARRAWQGVRANVEADSADVAERQSLQWLWTEIEYGGDFFGDLPEGGYRQVVDAMADGVDVRLGIQVVEVVQTAEGVHVLTADGASFGGSHVVVAVPLGVLKAGDLRFSPALEPQRRVAIEQLGFGRYEKVALAFAEPFWRAAGLSHLTVFPREPREPAICVFDLDAYDAGPVLAAHLFATSARRVGDQSDEAVAAWVLDLLAGAFDQPVPEPTAVAVTGWTDDPHTRGAYTHVPPGVDPSAVELLAQPRGGRLLFAGEHTCRERLGFADGALTSGIREAKRLLQQPRVRLGR